MKKGGGNRSATAFLRGALRIGLGACLLGMASGGWAQAPSTLTPQGPVATIAPAPAGPSPLQAVDMDEETTSSFEESIAPPLSIDESRQILMEIRSALVQEGAGAPENKPTRELWARMIRVVARYVQRVDDEHSTLPYYRWTELTSRKVRDTEWKEHSFDLRWPMEKVTALALRANRGDVAIRRLVVVDENKTRWEFNRLIVVPGNRLRPEIFFLPLPTRLVEIRIDLRKAAPAEEDLPRLYVEAGVCQLEESAKQAAFHLEMASGKLRAPQPDLRAAAQSLDQALALLKEYRNSRRL